ncbi:unnamed protein product [Danaus chrysippus]|uniref:(African queen) hypothetical protein n=1 Tax=Danaus chrysippus TaxID=151541 RepID=A0A8J2VT48_9NEOP|nr:unnamed protein product [Danaus chrysippus]
MKVEDANSEGIRGWGCTPPGEPPPAAVTTSTTVTTSPPGCLPPAVTRGWRRNALYGIIVFLIILVFLNIALTLWIISTLKLSARGIGPITIIREGIRLDGQAWFLDNLIASTLSSQAGQPLTLHSYRNFTILVSDENHKEASKLFLKRDSLECSGRSFHVRDARGEEVFHASREEVRVSSETLSVTGAGGLAVRGALQTPAVRAPPAADLQLESLTRRLDLRAPQSIHLESRAGSIDITSHSNIQLDSVVGAIKIDAPNIIISNLKEAKVADSPAKNMRKKVYQLCACGSGKLFLAPSDGRCSVEEDDQELCR